MRLNCRSQAANVDSINDIVGTSDGKGAIGVNLQDLTRALSLNSDLGKERILDFAQFTWVVTLSAIKIASSVRKEDLCITGCFAGCFACCMPFLFQTVLQMGLELLHFPACCETRCLQEMK